MGERRTTNTALLDVSQTGGEGVGYNVRNLLKDGRVLGCSTDNTIVDRELATQHKGRKSRGEDREGEEHPEQQKRRPLPESVELP